MKGFGEGGWRAFGVGAGDVPWIVCLELVVSFIFFPLAFWEDGFRRIGVNCS